MGIVFTQLISRTLPFKRSGGTQCWNAQLHVQHKQDRKIEEVWHSTDSLSHKAITVDAILCMCVCVYTYSEYVHFVDVSESR